MNEVLTEKLPVGRSTFHTLREQGKIYVDKTAQIYELAVQSQKFFFARPRRFGKSLLLSTLEAYFLGRKDLFKGLAIEQLEKDWKVYPVLHLSLNAQFYENKRSLEQVLDAHFIQWEKKYGETDKEVGYSARFMQIIQQACEKTGEKVVVLIDEYDKPLLRTLFNDDLHDVYREMLTGFYTVLKDADRYLRFVFITGVTKFSQLGIFSNLNQLMDISMAPAYATICGMTKAEIERDFQPELAALAAMNKLTYEQTVNEMTKRYDGYHFSASSPDIFNPFSLLSCFSNKDFESYWFASGTPTYLINMLKKFDVLPANLGKMYAKSSAFDAPTENMKTITPLLYQSGYITIKDYDKMSQLYTLDLPNKEIKVGLFESLLPNYLDGMYAEQGDVTIAKMSVLIRQNDMDGALRLLQTFLGTVPYCNVTNYEGHYQQMLFVIFTLLTHFVVDVEVHIPKGRVDIVMLTNERLYIIELKLNHDADTALRQINLKDYAERFALCGKPISKVGINFDSKIGNISDWKIEYNSLMDV